MQTMTSINPYFLQLSPLQMSGGIVTHATHSTNIDGVAGPENGESKNKKKKRCQQNLALNKYNLKLKYIKM